MSPLVLLIRHAAAEYKPGRLYGWTPGVHLSAGGRDEAKRLGERLEGVRLNAIYSSPLERCLETAEAVSSGRRLEIKVVEKLGEVRYGSWQGRTFRSLAKTPLWRTVQLVPSQARFPGGGESILELQRRGVETIDEIRTRHRRGVVAVFSHADMIKVILAHYLGLHLDLFQRLNVDTASVSAVAFGMGFPRVLRIGDTGTYESFNPPKPKRRKSS
ncbi:MAG TPA: MSMEG_4193 family putative phosphomutase [Actinomycetota bacterium]|nr:MSMEG_4193 family putative phosphomutase [Actinomycetota bacterium]